jgi:molybdate transport system regulatory protein
LRDILRDITRNSRVQHDVNPVLDDGSSEEQSGLMARLSIRIDFGNETAFGPGKARLLELIAEKGSIRAAAAAMDMSYRRAWLLIQEMEATVGGSVIAAETGGARGGGSTLTQLGRTVVDRYRAIEAQASRSVAVQLRALSKLADTHSGKLPSASARKKSLARVRKTADMKG